VSQAKDEMSGEPPGILMLAAGCAATLHIKGERKKVISVTTADLVAHVR
jgi:hypothetical protein